jgi:ribose transport system ATP-binding protein
VGALSTAQQQLVEIAKALSLNARVLIMDEPTSSLTIAEAGRLFEVVSDLRAQGVSVIYVSHRLPEIERLADRVIVLRDGRNAGVLKRQEINHDKMVRLMVGREVMRTSLQQPAIAAGICFEVDRLRTRRYPEADISLSIRKGEVLGLAGLVGAGRSELAEAVFGATPAIAGSIVLNGLRLKPHSIQEAIRNGIYLVPEDRRRSGVIAELTIRENVTLPSLNDYAFLGWIHRERELRSADKVRSQMGIKSASTESAVRTLSGGNQQKVVLAKWLSLNPKLIIFDEPTRGIDVGAKHEIHQMMRSLARQGVAVLMISSDMEEILGNSDRVAVMHEGRVTGILDHPECTEEAIMRLAVA